MQKCPNCGGNLNINQRKNQIDFDCEYCGSKLQSTRKLESFIFFAIVMCAFLFAFMLLLKSDFWEYIKSAMLSAYIANQVINLLSSNKYFAHVSIRDNVNKASH